MLTLEEKVGQKLIVGFHGYEPPDYILDWLARGRIGGVILFSRNVQSPAQVAKLTQACHAAAKHPILIGIDQEGGSVSRLHDDEGFTESPGAMALGAAGSEDLAYRVSRTLAVEMQVVGINWNYAPVVDIAHNMRNTSVGTRSLGTDKTLVSRLAAAEVRGFQDGGVAACAKHFPGLGNTPVDTHLALAVVDGPLDYLYESDMLAFRAAVDAGVASVMVSHVKFPALDADYPSTLSPVISGRLLRGEIGYDRVAVTDCLEMRAVADHYGRGESAVLAALAGIDLLLVSHTRDHQEAAYEALLEAAVSGRLPEEQIDTSLERINRLKAAYPITSAPDIARIRTAEHLRVMDEAARAGVVVLRADPAVFPLRNGDAGQRIAVMEFASYLESNAMEGSGQIGFESLLQDRLPEAKTLTLRGSDVNGTMLEHARSLAAGCDVLVLATRSAHLIPEQSELAREFLNLAPRTILVCLRNPYDAAVLSGAQTVMCTCGDTSPSIKAAVEALVGAFTPTGRLPVPLEGVVA